MIDMTRAMRHLAWSDAWLLESLADYPADAFGARFAPQAQSVGELVKHIIDGAEWYRYCLTGTTWTEIPVVTSASQVESLRAHLRFVDDELATQAALDDERMQFEDENGPASALRSTLLAEACLHAVEHRAQIAAALEASGFSPLRLEDADLWAFERFEAAQA